jgi:type IV pilus assembly protein PilY1
MKTGDDMNTVNNRRNTVNRTKHGIASWAKAMFLLAALVLNASAYAETKLADNPLFSTNSVSGNVALALSVEFPTALGSAYTTAYSNAQEYLGYWDANKCYAYKVPSTPFQGPYNTGVNNSNNVLSNGSNDPHWTATSTPSGISNSRANNLDNTLDPFIGAARWADADSAYIGGNSNYGTFVYETTFSIPASVDPALVEISFDLWADDGLSRIRLGNNNIAYNNSNPNLTWNNPGKITLPAGTFSTTGNQTIKLDILNTGGFGGMRIDNMSTMVGATEGNYFEPKSIAAANHVCNTGSIKYWSGNFLNWALTQTIDPFRYALSGGYRAVDTDSLTVLEKAWASGQGGTVVNPTITNNQTLIAQSTPFQSFSNLYIRIAGLGNKFYFTSSGNLYGGTVIADGDLPAAPAASNVYEMSARVKVCDSTFLESNCERYPSGNYKPTGLIQENAMKLNFAAFGYLLDDDIKRDGGVLRARMSALGPEKPVPGSSAVNNPNKEWDAITGIFSPNPNPTDAANGNGPNVTNSGVINYLNKFGLTAQKYKTYDPVSELYYTATRYFKKQGNVTAYTNNLDAAKKDGFPVITDWDDPIKYACQANFIIGIGDTNTWQDGNLPGSNLRNGNEPAVPTQVSGDTTVNVRLSTNKVGALEGISGYANLGEKEAPWCCDNNTFLMAGLAYDNHTKDIRPGNLSQEAGKQTIATYFLDVLEDSDRKNFAVSGMWNQYWLAAKYGGFNNVPANYNPDTATVAPAKADWDANNDGDPDNYFRANRPQLMIDGLKKAFDDILVKSQGGTSVQFSLSSPELVVGSLAFDTAFDGDGWTGDVVAGTVSFDAQNDNNAVTTKLWSAAEKLAAQNWNTGRFIATSKCSDPNVSDGTISCTNKGIPFKNANDLSNANKTDLEALLNPAQDVIDFLRGDTSKDGTNGFRIRKKTNGILGDIANSKLTVIGPPSLLLSEASNPDYYNFKATNSARKTMVYVGANDGMLHAFNGTADTAGGQERFAYVPSMLFKGPNNTPTIDGLVALSKQPYLHHAYVDATPTVQDVYFKDEGKWSTLLVGGLGKGGKGYYAIDVTDPSTLNNEANLAKAVKWEFTHKDLGYSYSKPIIVKVKDTNIGSNGWVVIFTSGYNNVDRNGYFFVLNPETGALLYKIPTYTSAPSTDAGLASPNVFINNYQDYSADAVYASDLLGNVWRLNLVGLTSTTKPIQFASLFDSNGVPQPITTRVGISSDIATGKRYVLLGTGQLLDDTDAGKVQKQGIYAISDGTIATNGYLTSATLPAGVSFPIKRGNLNKNSSLSTGVTSPAANSLGWYIDLEDNYLVNVDVRPNAGVLYVATNQVNGGVCDATSNGRGYQISFASGQSAAACNASVCYTQTDGIITNITLYRNATDDPNGPVKAKFGFQKADGSGGTVDAPKTTGTSGLNFRQLNWRDLPTAE